MELARRASNVRMHRLLQVRDTRRPHSIQCRSLDSFYSSIEATLFASFFLPIHFKTHDCQNSRSIWKCSPRFA